ncbi:hypothetical protein ACE04B_12120, partial [Rhizobium phaseoli]
RDKGTHEDIGGAVRADQTLPQTGLGGQDKEGEKQWRIFAEIDRAVANGTSVTSARYSCKITVT